MLAYRLILLAATISSASVAFADVLFQPGHRRYNQRDDDDPQSKPISQYQAPQNWGNPKYVSVQVPYHYYGMYRNPTQSHIMGFPVIHRPLLPHRLPHREYARPPSYGYHQPLLVHHRYRRSTWSDPGDGESGKPAVDDVAAKSSLTDTERVTAVDSYPPEDDGLADTNDKRAGKRQGKDDVTAGPFLFGLYPEKMRREYRHLNGVVANVANKSSPLAVLPASTPSRNEQPTVNSVKMTVPTRQTISTPPPEQKRDQDFKALCDGILLKGISDGNPTLVLPDKESDEKLASHVAPCRNERYDGDYIGDYRNALVPPSLIMPSPVLLGSWPIYRPMHESDRRNFPDPRPIYSSSKSKSSRQENGKSNKKSPQKSRGNYDDQRPSGINEMIGASNFDSSFSAQVPYDYTDYDASPFHPVVPDLRPEKTYPDPLDYPYTPDLDYPTYRINSDAPRANLASSVHTSPCASEARQFPSAYNYRTGYPLQNYLPQAYGYYY